MAEERTTLVVYGALWCPDARRTRRLLDEHRVPYEWHDIDAEPAAKQFVEQANGGQVILPTVVFPDGSMLVEPSDEEMKRKLGLAAS